MVRSQKELSGKGGGGSQTGSQAGISRQDKEPDKIDQYLKKLNTPKKKTNAKRKKESQASYSKKINSPSCSTSENPPQFQGGKVFTNPIQAATSLGGSRNPRKEEV